MFRLRQNNIALIQYERKDPERLPVVSTPCSVSTDQGSCVTGAAGDHAPGPSARLYHQGGVPLERLDADRDLFEAEVGLAQTRRDELLALVQLYRALGGGWQ
jgi:hypothetical protein